MAAGPFVYFISQGYNLIDARYISGRRIVMRVRGQGGDPVIIRRVDVPRIRLVKTVSDDGWKMSVERGKRRIEVTGSRALDAMGPILARVNWAGASKRRIAKAVGELEEVGDPARYFRVALGKVAQATAESRHLQRLPGPIRVALEMAAHEDSERRALEGDLARLEQRWEEAEELAAISDDLLLPASVQRRFQMIKRQVLGDEPEAADPDEASRRPDA